MCRDVPGHGHCSPHCSPDPSAAGYHPEHRGRGQGTLRVYRLAWFLVWGNQTSTLPCSHGEEPSSWGSFLPWPHTGRWRCWQDTGGRLLPIKMAGGGASLSPHPQHESQASEKSWVTFRGPGQSCWGNIKNSAHFNWHFLYEYPTMKPRKVETNFRVHAWLHWYSYALINNCLHLF